MKQLINKISGFSFFQQYLIFDIFFLAMEGIFRLISGNSFLSFSVIRIFVGINIISIVLALLVDFFNNGFRKFFSIMFMLLFSGYACAQLGFFNFLGVYISFQTSSQLGAVVDYVMDFVQSFKVIYFMVLIPVLLVFVLYLLFFRGTDKKMPLKIKMAFTLFIISIFSYFDYLLISAPIFQNEMQTVSNKDLFLTASNPGIAMEEYGSSFFCLLDLKAMFFPVEIEENYVVEDVDVVLEDDEYLREIDDSDWHRVIANENNTLMNSLNNYFINRPITNKNNMTGYFEGKNLIVIMMESANDILINDEYYPNFSKLLNGGWYFENNYSPRNSCATMNNEFSGMTSLYSIINTCTASKYKNNKYFESIFNLFNNKNYITFSAHDYTEAYYPRGTIHKNMGSNEYYGVQKLKIPYKNEYINWANDDDFMESVLKILDNKVEDGEPFMTWLTTVSSHQPYGVDSIQGSKYYNMTKNTKYPSDVRRYMSKLKILDDGLGVLLNGLEERGILDDTVIVLYGDHYPYGISTSHLNKVLDYDTSSDMNAERVPFVIYNSMLDGKVIDTYTSYINVLPTIANLFNLDYDPRLYLGNDLFSDDYQSLTVFADGSWKNEYAFYNASKQKIKYYSDFTYETTDIKRINDDITSKINISKKVIQNNYFEYLDKHLKNVE